MENLKDPHGVLGMPNEDEGYELARRYRLSHGAPREWTTLGNGVEYRFYPLGSTDDPLDQRWCLAFRSHAYAANAEQALKLVAEALAPPQVSDPQDPGQMLDERSRYEVPASVPEVPGRVVGQKYATHTQVPGLSDEEARSYHRLCARGATPSLLPLSYEEEAALLALEDKRLRAMNPHDTYVPPTMTNTHRALTAHRDGILSPHRRALAEMDKVFSEVASRAAYTGPDFERAMRNMTEMAASRQHAPRDQPFAQRSAFVRCDRCPYGTLCTSLEVCQGPDPGKVHTQEEPVKGEHAEVERILNEANDELNNLLVSISNAKEVIGRGDGGREVAVCKTKLQEVGYWLREAQRLAARG